jgi:hypothetical protein
MIMRNVNPPPQLTKKNLAILIVAFGVPLCLFVVMSLTSTNTPKEPIKTEVVGQYNNCDIIRLNIPSDAKYHYTLYCEDQK